MSCQKQSGGGFSVNVADRIGDTGMSAIKSYSDCQPPVIVGHKIANIGCNQTGGKSHKKSRKSSKKTMKRKHKSKRKSSKKSKSSKKHHSSIRKSRKSLKRKRSKKTIKKGGKRCRLGKSLCRKLGARGGSKRGGSANFPDSFNGEKSVYSADMKERSFGCRQPTWNANCI